MLKTIIKSTYMKKKVGTLENKHWVIWQVWLKHLYKTYWLQGLNKYYSLQSIQGWRAALWCYCKCDEKLL